MLECVFDKVFRLLIILKQLDLKDANGLTGPIGYYIMFVLIKRVSALSFNLDHYREMNARINLLT